ncbi:MAG: hypothetical protein RL621_2163 [Bacteroidota bacterium]|jgi:hypothetical protein
MKYFIKLLVVCFFSFQANAQQSSDSLHHPIVNFFNGLSLLEESLITSNTTKDFVLLEAGKIWNSDTLINIIQKAKLKEKFTRLNQFTFLQSQVHGNMAWVAYLNEAKFIRNSITTSVKWLESVVLFREENSWKIKLMHSTPVKN